MGRSRNENSAASVIQPFDLAQEVAPDDDRVESEEEYVPVTQNNSASSISDKDATSKQTVLRSGPVFFDNKPLVVKDWTPDVKMVKSEVEVVPIWIRFYGLDLKFWGLTLNKIAILVGKPVRLDTATHTKSFLGYARIMVEVSMGQDFPDVIEFLDEMDVCHRQIVHYEWKPVKCTECSGMGHLAAVCRKKKEVVQNKGKARQEWRPKPTQAPPVPPAAPTPMEIPLPTIDPTSIVTPIPVNGGILNTITPARIIIKLLRQGPDKAQETRVRTNNIEKVKNGLNKHWQLLHNNDIKDGGRIWLMCDEQVYKVELISKFAQVIHVRVTYMLNNFSRILSMVYGFNKSHEREDLWHALSSLGNCMKDPWLVMGDFNNVLFMDECIGSTITTAEYLKAPLKDLNREYFGHVETAAHLAEALLHDIQKKVHADPGNLTLQEEEKQAAQSFSEMEEAWRSFLAQKAKLQWLNNGDDNTHYFHCSIKARRRSNKVLQIKNVHGIICDNNITIEQAFLDYYISLLGSDRAVIPVCKGVMAHGALVSESQATVMIREVTDAEIKDALFSIPPDKAHGPDGYTSQFFKDTFPVVGPDIIQAVKDFFRNGRLL
ncbi:uncharacterized protein LOC141590242 [Silene latifolia]|uniref:uncharacterized protein LOC141590242 n=1 Tax=Silene latifolia TaxID=37657 RepID=UPI003D78B1BD